MPVELRFCGLDEVDVLVGFLRDHWGREHVLVTDRRVLDRQHRDEASARYDALLAWDGHEVVGVVGFVRTGRFDPALADGRDTVWLTTWRARDDAPPGTGLALVRGLERLLRPRWYGTVGMRASAEPLYRGLGHATGLLDRWVLIDPDADLRLVRTGSGAPVPSGLRGVAATDATPIGLVPLTAADLDDARVRRLVDDGPTVPARSAAYVAARFLADPFHAYRVHLAERDGHGLLIVWRAVEHAGARAVRIVDLVGHPDALAGAGAALLALLREVGAEHLDVHAVGHAAVLSAAGLHPLAAAPDLVVPSRYDPFEDRNVDLRFAIRGADGPLLLVKADADQDRPNRPVGGTDPGPA